MIIRAHGVGKEVYDLLERQGVNLVDATCPFVKKIHRIAQKEEVNGRRILIIGNAKHPEVEGILGLVQSALLRGGIPGRGGKPQDSGG